MLTYFNCFFRHINCDHDKILTIYYLYMFKRFNLICTAALGLCRVVTIARALRVTSFWAYFYIY